MDCVTPAYAGDCDQRSSGSTSTMMQRCDGDIGHVCHPRSCSHTPFEVAEPSRSNAS